MDLSSSGFSDSSQSNQCQRGPGNPVLPRCASDERLRLSSVNKNETQSGTGSRPPPLPPTTTTTTSVVDKVPPVSPPPPPPLPAVTVIEEECVEPFDGCSEHFVQRCIIIQRDEKGYGLTVSGDNPVFVQSVKEEGAAARAGVQRGDRIIKVNGTLVTQSNHLEVVKLIKSGSYVALTLLGRLKEPIGQQQQQDQQQPNLDGFNTSSSSSPSAAGSNPDQPYQREPVHHQLPPQNPHHQQQQQHHHHLPNSHSFPSSQHPYHHGNMNAANRSSSLSERITAPFPVDAELQLSLNHSRHQTMLQMLEQEKDYLEKIRCAYARAPTPKLKVELRNAQKLIASLEHQVLLMHTSQPPPNLASSPPIGVRSGLGLQLDPPPPPPPPRRHVSLPHQSSLPVPPVRVESKLSALSSGNNNVGGSCSDLLGNNGSSGSPPNHPPYPPMDNIQKLNALASSSTTRAQHSGGGGGGGPCHSRQRSSPDAILHLLESTGCQSRIQRRPELDLARSHSDVTPSMSTSSASAAVSNRKLVKSADSDMELVKRRRTIEGSTVSTASTTACQSGSSRASSFGTADSSVSSMTTGSPRVTPPGTPPPPYATFEGQPGEGVDRHQHRLHDTSTSDESPLGPPFRTINETEDRRMSSDLHANPLPDGFTFLEAPHSHLGSRLPFGAQQPIMSMEEDDFPLDGESGPASDHGPYNSLRQLCCRPGHLSVFIHFLISNSDPSSLFFYLISCMYKEGNAKDMRKWAYEIHSTFLVPGAPLKISNIEESILHDIDSVLQNDLEKEDILRNVFESAQQKAMAELNDQLADFRNKRTLGLGSIFGPSDQLLREAIRDKSKEARIIEQGLLPLLESFSEDLENAKDRDSAIASALASLLYKLFNLKTAQATTVIERCPLFVARDTRSKGYKFLKGSKKQNFLLTKGHHFSPQHYFNVTYCNHCQLIIWGVGNQGFQCQYCDMNIHKGCVRVIEENCIGARSGGKKDKKKDRVAGIVENIIGKSRKPSHNAADKIRRANEESSDGSALDGSTDSTSGDKSAHHLHHHHHHQPSRVEKLCKAFEPVNENDDHRLGPQQQGDGSNATPSGQGQPTDHPSPSSESSRRGSQVVRSESLRTRRESKPSFRKRSDPNIPRSNSDVDGEERPISGLNQSGSSSNSSLSTKSLDSPCNSLETVHRTAAEATLSPLSSSTSPASGLPSSSSSNALSRRDAEKYDSDLDVEADMPNWMDFVDAEVIRHMKPKEKKRQDVINELIYTERTHVRFLKVLERVFYRPMMTEQILPPDLFRLLFANLDEMIRIHCRLNGRLKRAKSQSAVVGDIGDILLQMFDGCGGEEFKQAAATFCKNQSIALSTFRYLNEKKTDPKVYQFHAEAMLNSLCRRLGLPDILPMGMQRLTKYPLLLENLAKYTCPTTDEHGKIVRALECSKEILNHVNHAIKEAENNHKLIEIQKKMDRGPFDKTHHPISQEFKNLDLTRYKMQHAGNLTWRIVRQKLIEVEVLLLDDVLVLLQKQDDKFVLKYHNISLTSGREETKLIYSPIIKLNNLLTRNVATDKKAFFLVSTSPVGPQIYELVAMSSNDRKTWLRHISEATESYKARDGKNKRPEHPITPISSPSSVERRETGEIDSVVVSCKSPETLRNQDIQEGVGDENETEHEDAAASANGGDRLDVSVPSASDDGLSSSPPVNIKNGLDLLVTGGSLSDTPRSDGDDGSGSSATDQLLGSSPSAVVGLLSPQQGASPLLPSPSSGSGGGLGGAVTPTSSSSPSPRRHFQRVEILQIAEGPSLIDPHEVVVSKGAVLQTAEPVLAPIEKLRRKDRVIRSALHEKLRLVAEILHIPQLPSSGSDDDNDLEDNWLPESDMSAENDSSRRDIKELVMAAVIQATRLDRVIEGLKISEEDAVNSGSLAPSTATTPVPTPTSDTIPIPILGSGSVSPMISRSSSSAAASGRIVNNVICGASISVGGQRSPALPVDRLVSISTSLNANLTQLLALVAEREEERDRLRKELRASREQIHLLHDASRRRTPTSPMPTSPKSQSRPNSFVSVGSSGSDHLCVADPIDTAIDIDPSSVEIPRTLEAYNKLVSFASTQQLLCDALPDADVGDPSGEHWRAEESGSGGESGVELFVDAPTESCSDALVTGEGTTTTTTTAESEEKGEGEPPPPQQPSSNVDGDNLASSSSPVYSAVL